MGKYHSRLTRGLFWRLSHIWILGINGTEWITNHERMFNCVPSAKYCAAFIKTCHRSRHIWLWYVYLVYHYQIQHHDGYIRFNIFQCDFVSTLLSHYLIIMIIVITSVCEVWKMAWNFFKNNTKKTWLNSNSDWEEIVGKNKWYTSRSKIMTNDQMLKSWHSNIKS